MAGWNGTGSQGVSFQSGGDADYWYILKGATATLGSAKGECYQVSTGRKATGSGAPITVTLTINGVSASVVVSNVVSTTEDSNGNKYPVSAGTTHTFTFNSEIKVDASTVVSGAATWSGVLACDSGGSPVFSPIWEQELKLVPVTRTITLNANGGSCSNGSGTKTISNTAMLMPGSTGPVEVDWSNESASRSGYNFLGWFTAPSGGTRVYPGKTTLYSDVTYYAHWSTYLSFNLDGGDYSFPQLWGEVGTGTRIPSSIPTKPGFEFTGWSGGKKPGDSHTFSSPTTLTAQWKRKTVIVNIYDLFTSESVESSHTLEFGDSLSLLPKSSKDKFRFVGWDTDEHLSGIMKSQNINYLWDVADYMKYLSGRWARGFKPSSNFVTYLYDGNIHTVFLEVGQDCLNPDITPTKSGCEFLGWTLDPVTPEVETSLVMESAPLLLYAVWRYHDQELSDMNVEVSASTSDAIIGKSVFGTLNYRYDKVTVHISASCGNIEGAKSGSNYVYLMYTDTNYNEQIIALTLGKQVTSIRGYRGAGSAGMIEDSTLPGYGGQEIEVTFNIPVEGNGFITAACGPNFASNELVVNAKLHGRVVTG